jgi:aminoglycoside phosphotransferase family enzyme/predicted kinase
VSATQGATVAFLRQWLMDVTESPDVEMIETHISIVLLAGRRALKLKRDVHLNYIDFSTPPLRLSACKAEFTLNRRTAPDLYLGVRTITRTESSLVFEGDGELVDAVVEMRRFDEDLVFDRLAERGRLSEELVTELAAHIAVFHLAAAPDRNLGGAGGIARVLQINEMALRGSGMFESAALARLTASFRQAFEAHRSALERRRLDGKVRRCHGDLHLRNICLFAGTPTLFDCLEFSEDLATIDVFYDLAFVLMDLWERNLTKLANLALNRYLDWTDDADGLGLLPFFMALRAEVRAHVLATRWVERPEASIKQRACGYFHLAEALLGRRRPRLIAIGGLSGSGKSTLAALLASRIDPAPGARIISTDRVRKRHFGVAPATPLPQAAYAPDISAVVYTKIGGAARRILAAGHSVIADAVFDRADDRAAIEAVAAGCGVSFDGLWLSAADQVLFERVAARRNDPSDATIAVVAQQLRRDLGTNNWRMIRAERSREETARLAAQMLGLATGN